VTGLDSPLAIASLVAGGVAAVLAVAGWRRHDEPGAMALPFVVFMLGAAIWSIAYGLALGTGDPGVRRAFEVPIEVGKALIAPAWLAFSLGYTGRGELLTRRVVAAVVALPVATIGLVATNDLHHLLWRNYRVVEVLGAATAAYDPGAWYYLHAVYGYLLVAAGLAYVVGSWLAGGTAYRDQVLALLVGSVAPSVAHVARTFRLGPFPTVDFTPLALSVTGVAFGYAFLRLELFGVSPATGRLGRRAAIDDVGVGVAVVDRRGRVVDLNDEAESVLDRSTDAARRERLDDLVDWDGERADGPAADRDARLVEFDSGAGRRTYEVTTSPVRGPTGGRVGATVAFHDVTARERRRQRLAVLNRVLRHNLRNELTVVSGYASLLAGELDEPAASQAATIEARAAALASLGETAGEIERMLAARDGPAAPVDVAALVRSVADAAGPEDDEDGTVRVRVGDEPTVTTHERLLRPVVEHLVENALEHGGASPTVEVRIVETADGVEVTVVDDGPGIPDGELAALVAGDETPLQHGSGLGLWLVRWGVDALGGELSFDDGPDGGAVVTVRLPAVTDGGDSPGEE
jgi:signal transduction histidine kinase